jgi:hypothetical protein
MREEGKVASLGGDNGTEKDVVEEANAVLVGFVLFVAESHEEDGAIEMLLIW